MSVPQENQVLPDFSLPAVWRDNGSFVERDLSNADFLGAPWVLFFYPRDATPGCTIEVCKFRDLCGEFQNLGVKVVGCSRDTIASHKKFIAAHNLPYPLFSDREKVFIGGWELLFHKTMYGKPVTGVSRDTFLIGADGKVRRIFRKVSPPGHAQEILQACRDLQP